jgi:Predicted nucleic-acid-binding protein containing a Zn-ribbon
MAGEQEILGPEAQYHAFLREGRFMIQRTKSDGQYVFYPRVANPTNGDDALEWVEASGRGVVYATTSTSRRPEQGGDYNIALVDLEEGPRMMARVVGIDPGDVVIGMEVQAHIGDIEGKEVLLFAPRKEGE